MFTTLNFSCFFLILIGLLSESFAALDSYREYIVYEDSFDTTTSQPTPTSQPTTTVQSTTNNCCSRCEFCGGSNTPSSGAFIAWNDLVLGKLNVMDETVQSNQFTFQKILILAAVTVGIVVFALGWVLLITITIYEIKKTTAMTWTFINTQTASAAKNFETVN